MEKPVYERVVDFTASCDLCGGKDPEGVIYRSRHYICLCVRCLEKIEASPESTRERVERFLMGNVV